MAEPRITPEEIAPTEDGTALRIRWGDGHVSTYEPRYLRIRCPCARCVEELTGRRILEPDSVPDSVYPRAIRYVGSYALRFDWSDGHDTGIYPYEFLREICPCEECGEPREGAEGGEKGGSAPRG